VTYSLSTRAQTAFHNAIRRVADMFFRVEVTINKRSTVPDANGEHPDITVVAHNVLCLLTYDVGLGGRYHTVEHTDLGQLLHDGWKLYFYKEDIDAAIPEGVDAEADSIVFPRGGKEYEIRMWTPSSAFADLSFLLYECDVRFNQGE
jgi:hypothetical protein